MFKILVPMLAAGLYGFPKFGSPHLDPAATVAGGGSATPPTPTANVIPLRDVSVEDIKSKNGDLYRRIGQDYARAERDREDSIKALIKESGCDDQIGATLFVACKDKKPEDAKVEIARVTSIEASLQSAKIAGLDDEDIKALRADIRDLPQITAVRHVQGFVNAKVGAKARLVNTPDPATNGKDPAKPGTVAASPVADAVAAARAEFAANFGEGKNGIMDLTEKNFVEQYLEEKKIDAKDSDLKAIAPDLFK